MKVFHVLFIIGSLVSLVPTYWAKIQHGGGPTDNSIPFLASLEMDISNLNEIDLPRSDITSVPGYIKTIIDITQLGLGLVDGIRTLFEQNFNGTTFNHIEFTGGIGEEKLLSMFHIISNRLNEIQSGVTGTQVGLRHLVTSLPHLVRWEIALASISEYALPINSLYHKFNFYQLHRDKIEDHTLSDFATSVVTHDHSSTQGLMANIHAMIAPEDPPFLEQNIAKYGREEYTVTADRRVNAAFSSKLRKAAMRGNSRLGMSSIGNIYFRPSIFTLLVDALEDADICSMNQSPQGMVYGFYTLLALSQARGYAMVNFAHLLLRYYNEGEFAAEQRLSDQLYIHYGNALQREVKKALSRASNLYRKCDPKVHKEGTTYVMITELLQGYIENEVDLNDRGTCTNQCSDYTHVTAKNCFQPNTQYCGKHRRCKGTVHNCRFIDADSYVCISPEKHRRYDWIRYENLVILGKESSCKNIMKVDSWWRFIFHCSYCFCYCDDPSSISTERYISLLPAVSDILAAKIVTGVRFIKKDKVIYIQIKEGATKPQGQIDVNSQRWVDVDPVDFTRHQPGTDYVILRYETRNIDLDTLTAPRGHVVTGLRFRLLGSHVNFEIWVTPINFNNGSLTTVKNYWMSNSNTPAMHENPRKEIFLLEPEDPRKAIIKNKIRSRNNTFIKMKPTSIYSDVAQLTVPFFDAQEVTPYPAVWLQGVDFYFRGTGNSGGFFGFSVRNYNLTSHFSDDVF